MINKSQILLTLAMLSLALPFISRSVAEDGVAITIDRIIENNAVFGTVVGLTKQGNEEHKVLVYVKTNQWYIHPFAHGGEGKSWASISSDGVWQIETVRRDIASSSVAALVVKKDAKAHRGPILRERPYQWLTGAAPRGQ